jgi:hypothetical protein
VGVDTPVPPSAPLCPCMLLTGVVPSSHCSECASCFRCRLTRRWHTLPARWLCDWAQRGPVKAESGSMLDNLPVFVFLMVAGAFLAGVYGERWRAIRARRLWQERRGTERGGLAVPVASSAARPVTDPFDQLRIVMDASFEKRRILSKPESRILYAAEKAIASAKLKWRVMAQVSLGEVLSSPDARAYSTINSKRVDLLVISSNGEPLAAIEYQGNGHYQGTAPARDAVKKEALRKAGISYIEFTPVHNNDDMAREILRLARGRSAKDGALNHLAYEQY